MCVCACTYVYTYACAYVCTLLGRNLFTLKLTDGLEEEDGAGGVFTALSSASFLTSRSLLVGLYTDPLLRDVESSSKQNTPANHYMVESHYNESPGTL